MKKMLMIMSIIFSGILFADVAVWVCDSNYNPQTDKWSFSVCADSDHNIAGYQFGVDIAGFTPESVTLGSDSDGVLTENGTTFSLAFSFTGDFIAAGENLELAVFTGSVAANSNGGAALVVAGGSSLAISDENAGNLTVSAVENGWDGSTLGSDSVLPKNYSLSQAYPNPFNPTTTIDYTLRDNGNVSIVIYDLMGRVVKELVNEFQFSDGGATHSVVWNGTDNSGNSVASGIYIYRMVSNDFTKSHRITLMK